MGRPPSSQIETAAATVESICRKNGLGLVMAENQTEQLTHSDTPSNADIGTSCVIVYVPTGNTGFATAVDRQLTKSAVGEASLIAHLSDWSEPGASRSIGTGSCWDRRPTNPLRGQLVPRRQPGSRVLPCHAPWPLHHRFVPRQRHQLSVEPVASWVRRYTTRSAALD